jgi:hypothetical protein
MRKMMVVLVMLCGLLALGADGTCSLPKGVSLPGGVMAGASGWNCPGEATWWACNARPEDVGVPPEALASVAHDPCVALTCATSLQAAEIDISGRLGYGGKTAPGIDCRYYGVTLVTGGPSGGFGSCLEKVGGADGGACKHAGEGCTPLPGPHSPQGDCCAGLVCSDVDFEVPICCAKAAAPCAANADCCNSSWDPHVTCASGFCKYECTPKPGAGYDGDPCVEHEDCVSCWCDDIGGCVDSNLPPEVMCGGVGDLCGQPGDADCCPGLVCDLGQCEVGPGN